MVRLSVVNDIVVEFQAETGGGAVCAVGKLRLMGRKRRVGWHVAF